MITLYLNRLFSFGMILWIAAQVNSLNATTITWTGTLDDDWNNTLNWSPTQIPTSADSVIITGNVNVKIYSGDHMACYHLSVESSDFLLINAGASLTISNGGQANAVLATGDVTNRGTLILENAYNGIVSSNDLKNEGTIIMNDIVNRALNIISTARIVNNGDIKIDGSYISLRNNGSFTNNGTYQSINTGANDIIQRGTLINSACATIESEGFENNSSSTTTNDGTMIWNGNEVVLNSSATFDNDGIIADHNNTDASILGYLTSSKVLIQSPSGGVSIGDMVADIIDASFLLFASDSIYTDRNLSHSAGPFNKVSKKWTVQSGAYGRDTFYTSIRLTASCSDTIAFYTQTPVLDCNDVNVFKGSVSELWDDAANWSLGQVPEECHSVFITGYNVEIPAGHSAMCRELYIIGNNDTLTISATASIDISRGNRGIVADDNCTLINHGSINIENIGGYGIFGTEALLINSGSILINSVEQEGIYIDSGLVNNSGLIKMSNTTMGGLNLEDGMFTNSDSIIINNSEGYGIDVSGANFNNSGTIIIDETGSTGLVLLERHLYNSGDITISGATNISLYVSDTLDNTGTIHILEGQTTGLFLNGYLSNYGDIYINSSDAIGLLNDASEVERVKEDRTITKSSRTSQFLNFGTLTLDGAYSELLSNNDILYNDTCGVITLYGGLFNADIINNYGTWEQDYSGQNSTTGTFNNHGLIVNETECFDDCIATSGCYVSTGLRFGGVIPDTAFARQTYDDILAEISASVIIDSIWYINPDLSDVAGVYDVITNSFTPDANSLDYYNLFVSVNIGTSGCSDTVMINFENAIMAPDCADNNALTSKTGATDWTSSRSWDLSRVPTDCDDISVEDMMINLEVNAGDTAVCHTLLFSDGTFTVDSSAVIIIQQE